MLSTQETVTTRTGGLRASFHGNAGCVRKRQAAEAQDKTTTRADCENNRIIINQTPIYTYIWAAKIGNNKNLRLASLVLSDRHDEHHNVIVGTRSFHSMVHNTVWSRTRCWNGQGADSTAAQEGSG